MKLIGSNPHANMEGVDQLPGKTNYFIGHDPQKWRTNVPNYGKVRYAGVYPGVDLIYYGNQGQLEYDFVVAPGADPSEIELDVGAAQAASLRLDANGDLALGIQGGEVGFHKPVAYQPAPTPGSGIRTERAPVKCHYRLTRRNRVMFEVASYDRTRPLIIDPTLKYSTYLGGTANDEGTAVAVDTLGRAYITGQTSSVNFPTTAGAFQTRYGKDTDAFVTKLNSAGSGLVYSTYLGGSSSDFGESIAVNASGDAYVTGQTDSTDFPVTPGAFQTKCAGACGTKSPDTFVTELNSAGSALVYSTYLGGTSSDQGNGIALDSSGNAYVVGWTDSTDFPTTAGAAQVAYGGGDEDAFVTKLNPQGSALVYSTYLGGSGDEFGYAIALSSSGNAHVTGYTNSTDFPTTSGAFQTSLKAPEAAFVTNLNASGSAFLYSTYLGGSGTGANPCSACGASITVDTMGNAYVSGLTWELDFPTTPGAFQTSYAGGFHDAFLTKLNPEGSALVYSTYVGGSSDDGAVAIKVDAGGTLYVRGNTFSHNFPVTPDAFQPAIGGESDAFFLELSPTGSALVYSTYLGGLGSEFGKATSSLALQGSVNPSVYLTGYTNSTNFPTTAGAFQTTFGGVYDAFVAKFVH
ncbi:MAG TPA: SBBP repeat-containing protein [Terriglobales bacterium]